MKKILGLAALAAAMTISASAATEQILCGDWSVSAGSGTFGTGSPANSGFVVCGAVAALPGGDTFSNFQVVVQTDYSGGTLGSLNTIQTTYTSTAFTSDTLTSTSNPGTGGSENYFSADSSPVYSPGGASFFTESTALTLPSSAFNVNYSSAVTTGTVQAETGQVYELVNYSTTAPEPMTFSLMGVGLLGMGLVGRRLRKQ